MEMPEDVMVEILSRVAVKSLLRFKCACKQWRRLISSRSFAYLHLNRSVSNRTGHFILIQEAHYTGPILPRDPVSFAPAESSNLELDRFTKFGLPLFIGSINGLVCLQVCFGKSVAILNPSTRVVREIRTKALQPGAGASMGYSMGFGWDPTANDYKVFRICVCFDFGGLRNWVEVWTANLQYWRECKVNRKIEPLDSHCNLIMEGFTYGLVNDGPRKLITQPIKLLVACFDVKDEILRFIPIPQLLLDSVSLSQPDGYGYMVNSSVFCMNWKGTFALGALVQSTKVYQVWTMDNDSVERECWSKKFTFKLNDTVPNSFATSINGMQVLLGRPGELIFYDLETKKTRKIKSYHQGISAYYHVESLLLIPWKPRNEAATNTNEIVHTRRGSIK